MTRERIKTVTIDGQSIAVPRERQECSVSWILAMAHYDVAKERIRRAFEEASLDRGQRTDLAWLIRTIAADGEHGRFDRPAADGDHGRDYGAAWDNPGAPPTGGAR